MHVRVGCDQSLVGKWTAKRPAHSLVASVVEFDGVGGYSLPPCGEGLGWGIARHSQIKGLFFKRIQRRAPSLTLPHEGGGDPLRPIKFTDATD